MANVLVIGATGYIGGRLVPRLLGGGHNVRCLVRDPRRVEGRAWFPQVDAVEGDVLKPETLKTAFADIDYVYYLVHSMGAGEEFEKLDRTAAENCAKAASEAGSQRIIYLGGLGKRVDDQSAHLRSRHEVGDVLRAGNVPVTEFRAAVIIGSGSISFELIHHLVNRLPVMICPRWVYTRTQPIAVADVLRYLVDCLSIPETVGRQLDIGGTEILTYREMMLTVARALRLKRFLIPVPVLTPRLSSYWVNLVTPIPTRIARPLIDGLKHETVCENTDAIQLFSFKPMTLDRAVERALSRVTTQEVETAWIDSAHGDPHGAVDPSHLRSDVRSIEVNASGGASFAVISSLGGDTGWLYGDWLWRLRGFIDQQFGGVELIPGERLLLRAEMKVWGQAWLEFLVEETSTDTSCITQTAKYYPRGLFGLLYWYGIYPVHALVFRGMIRAIGRAAELKYGADSDLSIVKS
jgi:uncharacterized protein YbjT (DUF2867 family)